MYLKDQHDDRLVVCSPRERETVLNDLLVTPFLYKNVLHTL